MGATASRSLRDDANVSVFTNLDLEQTCPDLLDCFSVGPLCPTLSRISTLTRRKDKTVVSCKLLFSITFGSRVSHLHIRSLVCALLRRFSWCIQTQPPPPDYRRVEGIKSRTKMTCRTSWLIQDYNIEYRLHQGNPMFLIWSFLILLSSY